MIDPITICIYIAITILIVIILSFIYIRIETPQDYYKSFHKNKVNETIRWLYQAVNDICYQCNVSPTYEIIETSKITYTDKNISTHNIRGKIYLVLWDDIHERMFNNNTIMYAILHEIAHILSPSIHHEPPFDTIESMLLNKAIDLGYYDSSKMIDPDYMTLDFNGPL